MDSVLYIAEMLIIGVGVGMISGALGLGGGILMVPAFQFFVSGIDAHTAKGTSLFIIIFVVFLNAWRLNKDLPKQPWRLAALLAAGSVVGSYTGAWVTARMPERAVIAIFVGLLGLLALRTFLLEPRNVSEQDVHRRRTLTVGVGLIAGLCGGATGTGGGIVLVPLALLAGIVSNERIAGLSNMVMVATSIAGSIAHLQAERIYEGGWTVGHVSLSLVPLVLIGAQFGSPIGKAINAHLTLPRRRLAMGILLLALALQLLHRLFG